jgi:transcriptional regulator with XRE-family HTH domain
MDQSRRQAISRLDALLRWFTLQVMRDPKRDFATNLRHACSTRPSASHFCREIGLNRQQFNRYVNGQARPSPHNLLRIAASFGLDPTDFDRPARDFRRRFEARREPLASRDPLQDAYPGEIAALRKYLGFFQTWHLSLSWPGRIVCSGAHLREEEGKVLVTSLERIDDPESGIRQRSRYVGLAAYRRNRIFITERTRGDMPTFGQTILMPFEVHQRLYLRGVTMGVSWRRDNQPYASRMIWRFHGQDADKRQLIARCGAYPADSRGVPAPVVTYLASAPLVAVDD